MISIIVPVLNEASTIQRLLDGLTKNASAANLSEVMVVDGGSTDGTQVLASQFFEKLPLVIVQAPKGRAVQMNAGAQKATGSILYFLHADTLPPKGFDQQILHAYNKGAVAGCFRMKFDSNHPILLTFQWFTRFNSKFCRGGDQSLFVTKKAFDALGGYNESFDVYEDCELIHRLYDAFSFMVLNDHVITSARRYQENGTLRLQYHFAIIHCKKWLGASPKDLSKYYKKYILS